MSFARASIVAEMRVLFGSDLSTYPLYPFSLHSIMKNNVVFVFLLSFKIITTLSRSSMALLRGFVDSSCSYIPASVIVIDSNLSIKLDD